MLTLLEGNSRSTNIESLLSSSKVAFWKQKEAYSAGSHNTLLSKPCVYALQHAWVTDGVVEMS